MRARRNDDSFRITTFSGQVKSSSGLSVDEWNIFAPDSGLFDSRCRLLKEEIWKQRLQLSMIFLRVYTLYENQSQEATRSMDQILRFTGGWEQERHPTFQQIIVETTYMIYSGCFRWSNFLGTASWFDNVIRMVFVKMNRKYTETILPMFSSQGQT